ncbi:coiled-coil domain-containing protein 74A-like isoform X2 [Trichosurus vulpecula]|uniref:coiled-coil domain-containing protein 74A-like isoform X2 n=1 Tax=Trichosurus vulpecula TaxID=9337 RepID=UPI00186B1940|nr:coiled-coil domain-containing protein 74A-like isoform X2 [Trichosurus vulpecula]
MSCQGLAEGPGPPASAAPAVPSRLRVGSVPQPPPPPRPGPPLGLLGIGPAPVVTAPPAALPGAPELQKRVLDLEKSLQFVQQQHADTLLSLHAEVDQLRRDNRDLHYKLIMNQKPQRKGVTSSSSHFLKSSSGVVPSGCSASKAKHSFCCPKRQEAGESGEEKQGPSIKMEKGLAGAEDGAPTSTLIPMMSCQPPFKHILGITSSLKLPPHTRKLSTLRQCELVIRQLWNANHLQAQELQRLKSVLEDGTGQTADGLPATHSKRAFGEKNTHQCAFSAGSCARHQEGMQFPKVADKSAAKKCLILAPIPGPERAVLPALKQTLRNSFAERQKKMQAIQSRRLHRTVL